MSYSAKHIPETLIDEIKEALQSLSFGSIEIYVQDSTVTQITVRSIKKVKSNMKGDDRINIQRKLSPYRRERNMIEQASSMVSKTQLESIQNKIEVLTFKK